MISRKILLLIINLLSIVICDVFSSNAFAREKNLIHIQVLSTLGPQAFLSGSSVVLSDNAGKKIGAAISNSRGSAIFTFSKNKLSKQPLSITVKGGKVLEYSGETIVSKERFKARLFGKIDNLPLSGHVISYVDLISTIASRASSAIGNNHNEKLEHVRNRFGLPKSMHSSALRHPNKYQSWALTKAKSDEVGGIGNLIQGLVKSVENPNDAGGVNPEGLADYTFSFSETNSGCDSANNASNGVDVLDIGSKVAINLMEHVGIPELLSSTVIGLLLPNEGEQKPTLEAIHAVSAQLACVNQGLAAIQHELAQVQFQLSLGPAVQCGNAVVQQYQLYEGLVEQAGNDPSKLGRNNPVLMADLPEWNTLNTNCGAAINNMLFGTAGGQAGAWSQLNKNYQGQYPWYTPEHINELRAFLAYWSTIQANQIALYSEYNKFNGLEKNTEIVLGLKEDGNPKVCKTNSTPSTPTLCVWRSNIDAAMPESLLSDEIGSWQRHRGYMALPAGLYSGSGPTPSARTTWFNMVNIATSQWDNINATSCDIDVRGVTYYFQDAINQTYNYHINSSLNPYGLASNVEFWWNPQMQHNNQWNGDDRDTLSKTSGGLDAASFFASKINGNPYPDKTPEAWGSAELPFRSDILSRAGAGFVATSSSLVIRDGCNTIFERNYEMINANIALLRSDIGQPTNWENHFKSNPPTPEVLPLGTLLYRQWWPGSDTAANFVAPPPPQ
jgi:hypothetical protein